MAICRQRWKKKSPRYPLVPAALIGRLAISTRHQGQKIGGALVIDAVLRAFCADPAVFAILADAKVSISAEI